MVAPFKEERIGPMMASDGSFPASLAGGQAIAAAPVGILWFEGPDGTRVAANARAEMLLGAPVQPDGGIHQHVGRLLYPDGRACPPDDLPAARALRGEIVHGAEMRVRAAGGQDVWVLVHAAPDRDAAGNVTGALVILDDVTALRELVRLDREWTVIIAHDLRQPVAVIVGYVELLARRLRDGDPALVRPLDHILSCARRLNRMINDLLDVSQIETNRLSLDRRRENLAVLIPTIVERLGEVTAGHAVRLAVEPDLPLVRVDPSRIEQVLGNLLANAARYSYPGTDITVEVRRTGEGVEVIVRNTGDGIAPEEMPHLFARFHRTSTGAARHGLGLGLYICRGLIEGHGGRLWAESTPGETTAFHFSLPAETA
jgi:signal transduction histidine kinase